MQGFEGGEFSSEARRVFAAILARLEEDQGFEVERALAESHDQHPELRELYARWKRLEDLLAGVSGHSEAFESVAHELASLGSREPLLEAALARIRDRGAAVGRYELRERIGRGGMGVVWRVHDRDLDRELALKVLRGRGGAIRARAKRLLAEARLAARLDHPGIVPVYDVGIDERERVYFTMRLVEGEAFGAVLRSLREGGDDWSQARALETLLKVCDTLAYAHVLGIVHRDLKPANVMVGRFGEVYVLDWGLARVVAPGGGRRGIAGTPAYMSPEQARGEPAGPRADVYSCGAMLYELLCGRSPYSERASHGFEAILDRVRADPPADLSSIAPRADAELAAICRKAMAREPNERYASAVEFAQDLRAHLEDRVVRAHARGALAELRKWVVRNRALALSLCALILSVITASFVLSWVQARGKADVLSFADARRLEELELRARDLGPALPERLPTLRAWIAEAEALIGRRQEHARRLAVMRGRASPDPTIEQGVTFDDAEDRWLHATLTSLVAALDRFADPESGRLAAVRDRATLAEGIEEQSLVAHAPEWREAIDAIADKARSPVYQGLRIRPQLGLVPLGPDPGSGLWEFAHLASGEPPARDAAGVLTLSAPCGIVLVLLPAGRFAMGSVLVSADDASHGDAMARTDEEPVHAREIGPFFLSKYELTRAQWLRATGARRFEGDGALLPADEVSWPETVAVLRDLALELPLEEQWEFAARAGTTTRWSTGEGPGSLAGAANGSRGVAERLPGGRVFERVLGVHVLRPNPFGLHNVHGNVAEWTASAYRVRYDAEVVEAPAALRVVRGGSYASTAAELRSAARSAVAPRTASPMIGIRPARALAR